MASEAAEGTRHFYLAVDRHLFKMETLVDVVSRAAGGRRRGEWLGMVVCCSTRDQLDSVLSSLSSLSSSSSGHSFSLSSLYSDQAEAERAMILEKFRQTTTKWHQNPIIQSENTKDSSIEDQKSHLVVVTDACLPLLTSGELPLAARVLINYELPTKKETYTRRMASCLAGDGIVVNMVVGGEVVILKSIEESTSLLIAEMPIDIFEIL